MSDENPIGSVAGDRDRAASALTPAEMEALWHDVKIAPSVHDRGVIEAAVGNILTARTANLNAALNVVDSLVTAAECRSRASLSRDFEGNPPAASVPAQDLRAAIGQAFER